jgi:hypothetical protein
MLATFQEIPNCENSLRGQHWRIKAAFAARRENALAKRDTGNCVKPHKSFETWNCDSKQLEGDLCHRFGVTENVSLIRTLFLNVP